MGQKDRYHETVNHTCDNTSLLICLHMFAHISKCSKWHALSHFLLERFHRNYQKRLSTMMSCMTHMISFLCGKSHINGREKLGTMMPCTTHVISFLYGKSHINSPKNIGTMMLCMTHLMAFFYGKFHINSPKKLGTMMPRLTKCYSLAPNLRRAPRLSPTICAALLPATNSGWNVSPHRPQQPGLEAHQLSFPTKHDGATPHPLKQLQGEVLPIWQPMLRPPTASNTPPPQNNHHPTTSHLATNIQLPSQEQLMSKHIFG